MKAARFYGAGDIRVEDVPEPSAQASQIKIKIAWAGICGSDLHCYVAPLSKMPTATVPDKLSGETLPITIGHEFSGTIVELGQDVDKTKFSIGQNVVVEPVVSCMKSDCQACTAGTRNLCPLENFIGIGGFGGGLAEYITVNQYQVYVLPSNISLEVGACIEPLAVAWYAIKRSDLKPGDKVAIFGAGPIGLFLLKVLKGREPSCHITVFEPAGARRRLAEQNGADAVVDPKDSDSNATVDSAFDIAFDAAGVQETLNTAVHLLRARGQLVVVATWEKPILVDVNSVIFKETNIIGINAYTGIHEELIQAVANGVVSGVESLITSKVALDDVVDKGFLALLHHKETEIKILVHP